MQFLFYGRGRSVEKQSKGKLPLFAGKLPFLFSYYLVQCLGRGDHVKLKIEENPIYEETEIIIQCPYLDEDLQKLIKQIHAYTYSIRAEKQGDLYSISVHDILYFTSKEEQTYLHCEDGIYTCDKKLYELEMMLKMASFVRISKSCIVNCAALLHVRPLFDGKFEAVTKNKDVLIINRHYVKAFKEVFGL